MSSGACMEMIKNGDYTKKDTFENNGYKISFFSFFLEFQVKISGFNLVHFALGQADPVRKILGTEPKRFKILSGRVSLAKSAQVGLAWRFQQLVKIVEIYSSHIFENTFWSPAWG